MTTARAILVAAALAAGACSSPAPEAPRDAAAAATAAPAASSAGRQYLLERVGDAAVVQLYADGFEELPLRDKLLVWHLQRAALAGRDIYYDQRYRHSLEMRDLFEAVLTHAAGVDPSTLAGIQRYAKLFWLHNGPYNYDTSRKFTLTTTPQAFAAAVHRAAGNGAAIRLRPGESLDALLARLQPLFFDATVEPMVTQKSPARGQDMLLASANNLYAGVAMADLTGFTERYGRNSRLVKENGRLREEVYRLGGRYDPAIRAIIGHLEAAMPYATPAMRTALEKLVVWYRTGEDADRRAYDIAWVQDRDSAVDTTNGFIETYLDPRGVRGSWQGLVAYVHPRKTRDIRKLAAEAQWFENHMPWDPRYRKPEVQGIVAQALDVVVATGDAGPMTAIGVNLPNDQEVRERYGSKSALLANTTDAYDRSTLPSMHQEFAWDAAEVSRFAKWGALADELTTNMHEVIGHASGRVSGTVGANPAGLLKEHYSALEEARADLVALYFLADPKLAALGLLGAGDQGEIVQAAYEDYAKLALRQLRTMREGTQIEDDHMRNRQMIVHWLMANTTAIETRKRAGKTFYVVTDRHAFRDGAGRLLAEVQRIKGEGDHAAAGRLFERYGVHFDPALRDEIVARVDRLRLPSYTGFVMPKLEPVRAADGSITDVRISYPMDLTAQMLEYSGRRTPARR